MQKPCFSLVRQTDSPASKSRNWLIPCCCFVILEQIEQSCDSATLSTVFTLVEGIDPQITFLNINKITHPHKFRIWMWQTWKYQGEKKSFLLEILPNNIHIQIHIQYWMTENHHCWELWIQVHVFLKKGQCFCDNIHQSDVSRVACAQLLWI